VTHVLAHRDDAFSPEETEELLRERLGDAVLGTRTEYATFTVDVANEALPEAALLCRDERVLAYDFFDCLFGVDRREEGFDVVAVLYSTSTGNRLCLRTHCPGGREAPTCPSITEVYRGADWHERETWDMFGIEFTDHPGLEPRILTVENFEGWPLRKDFYLGTRVAKPWPGVKEPAELDEDGNVIERVPRLGDAPGPYELDKAMAEQAKLANPAPDTPAEVEEVSEQKPGTAEGEAADEATAEKAAADIDQATYDALIAEGKSERIARSKAKAAFVKKQRQRAADEASDQGAETPAGERVAEDAEQAEVAEDSGQVVAGDVEQQSEEDEAQATEVSKEEAGEAAHEESAAAAERVEEEAAGDEDAEGAETARERAEEKRRAAAEARARKAAERAREGEAGDQPSGAEGPRETGSQPTIDEATTGGAAEDEDAAPTEDEREGDA
jgi:NADH:ubiquinone oxidoreductase subunit C